MPPATTDFSSSTTTAATSSSSSTAAAASSSSSSSFTRSLLSIRRGGGDQHHHLNNNQVHSDSSLLTRRETDLDSFQRHVADRFSDLSEPSDSAPLLSVSWIRKLLDAFLSCHVEFDRILAENQPNVYKPPLDRLVNDYFDRSVKALDVCNAVRDGIEQIREWNKILDIVLCALGDSTNARLISEGQFRRAKKAVVDLSISMMIDEKESTTGIAHRNRSFGRHNQQGGGGRDAHSHHRHLGHFRSLSWSVSRSWSAAKQLQAIGNNLVPPRGAEVVASGGIAVVVYTMSCVLLFVMWALVAAIPCQDRGLQVHFVIPRQYPWVVSVLGLHDRVMEESKRRERRNGCGLLAEIYQMEKSARAIMELADTVQFPLMEEKEMEVREKVDELRQVYDGLNEGLDPLERQVREVFHNIVHSRTEGLDSMARSSNND